MSVTQEKAAPRHGIDKFYREVWLKKFSPDDYPLPCDWPLTLANEYAEAVNKELLEALRKYGKHLTACACFEEFDEKACDCGFGKYEAAL